MSKNLRTVSLVSAFIAAASGVAAIAGAAAEMPGLLKGAILGIALATALNFATAYRRTPQKPRQATGSRQYE